MLVAYAGSLPVCYCYYIPYLASYHCAKSLALLGLHGRAPSRRPLPNACVAVAQHDLLRFE